MRFLQSFTHRANAHWQNVVQQVRTYVVRVRNDIARKYAILLSYAYKAQYELHVFKAGFGGIAVALLLLILISCSLLFVPALQQLLEPLYSSEKAIESLRALLLNVGGPLIGATAIVSSLVLFSIQVNVERMPHGLFQRLSSDPRLLGAFAVAFVMAICVAFLSVLVDKSRLAHIALAAAWQVVAILCLFMYSYKRALYLINPLQQLKIVLDHARSELGTWARRADRARVLLENTDKAKTEESPSEPTHDIPRTTYFRVNTHWTMGAQQAVRHAMSFARRFAEHGDHEISAAALNVVIGINAAYVAAKGKTFYGSNGIVENPLTTDVFLNGSLEHLRQHASSGLARRDEEQIEQTMRAMRDLVRVYLGADYGNGMTSKTHAHLAAGYLSRVVQDVIPHEMADVLMEGITLMGESAQLVLRYGKPVDMVSLSEKIALIACTGAARKEYRPITSIGMAQLAKLTFDLLRTPGNHDIHFVARELQNDVTLVAKMFLKLQDTPIQNAHSTYLAPYYSSTSKESLRHRLILLANAVSSAKADDINAQTVITNLQRWAKDIYENEKELLLAAVEARSHFTFDAIRWITGVTEVLLAVSNADACDEHNRKELREHARWLMGSLTWIPDDKESVNFVENFQLTDTLFQSTFDAVRRDCNDLADDISQYLLNWTFKAGKHERGWGILERGLNGAAVLAVARGDPYISRIRREIGDRLTKGDLPDQDLRDRTSRQLRKLAASLYRRRHLSSSIDMATEQSDHAKVKPLLEDIANLLSPATAEEPVETD